MPTASLFMLKAANSDGSFEHLSVATCSAFSTEARSSWINDPEYKSNSPLARPCSGQTGRAWRTKKL